MVNICSFPDNIVFCNAHEEIRVFTDFENVTKSVFLNE